MHLYIYRKGWKQNERRKINLCASADVFSYWFVTIPFCFLAHGQIWPLQAGTSPHQICFYTETDVG